MPPTDPMAAKLRNTRRIDAQIGLVGSELSYCFHLCLIALLPKITGVGIIALHRILRHAADHCMSYPGLPLFALTNEKLLLHLIGNTALQECDAVHKPSKKQGLSLD